MRIRLDYDDGLAFSTVTWQGVKYRALVVKIAGKAFNVWRTVEGRELYLDREDYMRMIDQSLVTAMESMFTNIFTDAIAAVPEGAELLKDK